MKIRNDICLIIDTNLLGRTASNSNLDSYIHGNSIRMDSICFSGRSQPLYSQSGIVNPTSHLFGKSVDSGIAQYSRNYSKSSIYQPSPEIYNVIFQPQMNQTIPPRLGAQIPTLTRPTSLVSGFPSYDTQILLNSPTNPISNEQRLFHTKFDGLSSIQSAGHTIKPSTAIGTSSIFNPVSDTSMEAVLARHTTLSNSQASINSPLNREPYDRNIEFTHRHSLDHRTIIDPLFLAPSSSLGAKLDTVKNCRSIDIAILLQVIFFC